MSYARKASRVGTMSSIVLALSTPAGLLARSEALAVGLLLLSIASLATLTWALQRLDRVDRERN